MEFKTNKENLLNYLQMLNGIVERKQTLPILSHILLETKKGLLYLTGSDLEIELNLFLEVEVIVEGKVTVPAYKIFDICKSFNNNDEITFKTNNESKVLIYSGNSKFSLSTLLVDNFPKIENFKEEHVFKIQQNKLLNLFKNVSFSMAAQDVRYYLNGLLLEIKEKKINVVATDGHRLAIDSNDMVDYDLQQTTQVIIPRKAALEIIKILNETDSLVEIKLNKNQLLLTYDNISLMVRLIDGRYPDYNKVIPKNNNKEIVVNKELFSSALQRAAILSNEKYHGITLNFSKNKLNIHANNAEREEAQDEIILDYDYDNLEVGFNVGYLLDAIDAVQSQEIKLVMKDSNESCLVQYKEKNYPSFIVMPMRL